MWPPPKGSSMDVARPEFCSCSPVEVFLFRGNQRQRTAQSEITRIRVPLFGRKLARVYITI